MGRGISPEGNPIPRSFPDLLSPFAGEVGLSMKQAGQLPARSTYFSSVKETSIMKTLVLTFNTTGRRTYTLTVNDPKDDLTLDTVKTQAAALSKVLETRSGATITGLQQAEFVTETRQELE